MNILKRLFCKHNYEYSHAGIIKFREKVQPWLKSLKDRVQPYIYIKTNNKL